MNTELSCQYEKWKLDLIFVSGEDILGKIIKRNEKEENLKKIADNLSSFSKRILYLKYNYNDNLILSNKNISKLMCCSEETIRKKLEEIKQKANI